MIDPVPRPGFVDRLFAPTMLLRILGAVLLVSGVVLAARGRWGYFSGVTAVLGIPAGLGMVLLKPWGRVLGLVFFAAWGVLALILIGFGKGPTQNNLSLLVGAGIGGWTVYRWTH